MLLSKLVTRQREKGMSDADFAALLGVPRSTWQLTRSGRVPLGRRVALAAQRAFGDLSPEVIYFLLSDASEGARDASELAHPPHAHQDANLAPSPGEDALEDREPRGGRSGRSEKGVA